MALTSTTTFDIANQTQTINFYSSSVLVDSISYSAGVLNYANVAQFNLSKSDIILYFQYLNIFNNTLLVNFPSLNASLIQALPLCQFDFLENSIGTKKLIYTQNSQGNSIYTITYVVVGSSASFAARSALSTTIQEFLASLNFFGVFVNQITLN